MDKVNYDRYIKLKTKQCILSEEDIHKVKDIIRNTFKGKTRWTDGSEFYNDEDFLEREFGNIRFNINRPGLGYNRKTHVGPLHAYSHESINKFREIFGRKFPFFMPVKI